MQSESPLQVTNATKERVRLDAETLFGDRRWVTDGDGRRTERCGPSRAGDRDAVRTIGERPERRGAP